MKKIKIFIIILFVLLLIPLVINGIVILSTKKYIKDEVNNHYDIAMVLGCGIKNNQPTPMLKDRLDAAIKLYEEGMVNNILITGDEHDNYSEIKVMKEYLLNNNIEEDIIIEDKNGYNTGASIENYKHNFADKTVIIITQKYHMYRALYIANHYDIKYIGYLAKEVNYRGQLFRSLREILARSKDFLKYL